MNLSPYRLVHQKLKENLEHLDHVNHERKMKKMNLIRY
jgi:hypothetical protein